MLRTAAALSVLLGGMIAGPALAQDAKSLDGFYAGAQVGFGKPQSKLTLTPQSGAAVGGSASKAGFEFGGFAGYGKVIGDNFYLGAEANLANGGAKASRVLAGSKVSVDPGLQYGAAARAGMIFQDGGLLYGKLGVERQKVQLSLANAKRKVTEQGLVYGVGYERQLSTSLALRGEITRVDYGDKTARFPAGDRVKIDGKETRFTVGALMRF